MTPVPQYPRKSRTNSRAMTVKDGHGGGGDSHRKHRSLSLSSTSHAEQHNNISAAKVNQENNHPDKASRPDKLVKHSRKGLAVADEQQQQLGDLKSPVDL